MDNLTGYEKLLKEMHERFKTFVPIVTIDTILYQFNIITPETEHLLKKDYLRVTTMQQASEGVTIDDILAELKEVQERISDTNLVSMSTVALKTVTCRKPFFWLAMSYGGFIRVTNEMREHSSNVLSVEDSYRMFAKELIGYREQSKKTGAFLG